MLKKTWEQRKKEAEWNSAQQLKFLGDSARQNMEVTKELGLNPSMMYGGSGIGGQSTSVQSQPSNGASVGQPQRMNIDPTLDAQLGLIKAQTDNINADTENKRGADRENTIADTELKKMSGVVAKYLGKEV